MGYDAASLYHASCFMSDLLECKNTKQRQDVFKLIKDSKVQEIVKERLQRCDEIKAQNYIDLIEQLPGMKLKKQKLFEAPDYLQERIMKKSFIHKPAGMPNDTSERE